MTIRIDAEKLSARRTFFCGQCFRWSERGSVFEGVAGKKVLKVREKDGKIELSGASEDLLKKYFSLDEDYSEYITRLSEDKILAKACSAARGIRILRQEPFETLISFIISQNNNIPRISGIISRFCEQFGEKIGGGHFSFPEPKALAGIEAEDLSGLRAGFRARYIADAVKKVNSGEIDFEEIEALPLEQARERLKIVTGVGDKVADCTLLFGFHKLSAFPRDVWIKRVMSENFPQGLPDCAKGIEGVAQQFLFDYFRNLEKTEADKGGAAQIS